MNLGNIKGVFAARYALGNIHQYMMQLDQTMKYSYIQKRSAGNIDLFRVAN